MCICQRELSLVCVTGARQLRSAARDLNTVQLHSVDVIGFLVFATTVAFYLIKLTCSKCFRWLLGIGRSRSMTDVLTKKNA